LSGFAQGKSLHQAQRGIKVDPIRVAKAVATVDLNGNLTYKRVGPWIPYHANQTHIANSQTTAYDEYEFTDAVSLAPGNNPAYTANCDSVITAGSRWFFGDGYIPGYRYNDLKVVSGAAGLVSDRAGVGFYTESDALFDFQYFIFTTENFPDDVNGLDPNDGTAAGRGDYDGVVASYGTLAMSSPFYYYSDIDLDGLGFGWQMPTDGSGGTLQLAGDVDASTNTITLLGQCMLWGVNAGNPTPPVSDLEWDDDDLVDLIFTPNELYSYLYGLCPEPLGAMLCFLYTPGATTETLAPTSEQILLGTTGSGGNLASWASNDGNIRNICKFFVPFPTSPFIRANLNYTTTKAAASVTAISFNTRIGSKTGGGQAITLKVQNKTTSAFVNTSVVNQSVGSLPHDSTGAASGTLADYVGGGGAMTGQIEVSAVGFQVVAFPCTGFDSANMVVTG
jgi:hypothetical protein